jgi:hypothetical protein
VNQLEPLDKAAPEEEIARRQKGSLEHWETTLQFWDSLSGKRELEERPWRKLREGTQTLLKRPPEEDFNWVKLLMTLMTVGLTMYTLGTQIRAVYNEFVIAYSKPNADRDVYNAWILAGVLAFKEVFFLTNPIVRITCIAAGVVINILSIVIGACAGLCCSVRYATLKHFITVTLFDVLKSQYYLLSAMSTHLSSLYRIMRLGKQIYSKELNTSIKDFDTKLTSLSNVIYNIIVLVVQAKGFSNEILVGLLFSLALLFRQMVDEKLRLRLHYHALNDLNENRLTKFEIALYLTKLCEDFLTRDVQYNFVEHFYSSEKFHFNRRPVLPEFAIDNDEDRPKIDSRLLQKYFGDAKV